MKGEDINMVTFREAMELVLGQARSFGVETVRLGDAFGRVLAVPVRADRDYPPFPRATMDGFALRHADLGGGIREFRVVEVLFAGMEATGGIGPGECYKIMTGAAVPADADMVIRREDVVEVEAGMRIQSEELGGGRPFLNIARQGEDLSEGELVIAKPCRCEPAVMGLLATLGFAEVTVAKLPRVALLTTGGEVVEPGMRMSAVQIRNSNRWMLEAALRKEAVGLAVCGHVADDPLAMRREIEGMMTVDVLILTGGVSAGDADHVPGVLSELGVRQLFHKIAMRPGKPTWCGVLPSGGMVFALPGNPFSCLVNFILLIAPYLHACWGLERSLPMALPLGEARKRRTALDEFFPVRVEGVPAKLIPMALNGSGDIRMGLQANALALHPAELGDLEAGREVQYYSFV